MKLYTGTVEQFNQDVLTNQMPDKLQRAYETTYYYRMANPREVQSWNNSLQFMKNAVEYASLKEDMIVVEYELPYLQPEDRLHALRERPCGRRQQSSSWS